VQKGWLRLEGFQTNRGSRFQKGGPLVSLSERAWKHENVPYDLVIRSTEWESLSTSSTIESGSSLFCKAVVTKITKWKDQRLVWSVHCGCCHYAKVTGNFGRKSNGKVRFGFFRPEYSGSPLEVVHLFRSDRSDRSDQSLWFNFDKTLHFPTHLWREFGKLE